MIKAILHADREWGIGKKNDLMFSLPADMKFFRQTTSGKTVVCGENTLASFPGGLPLKNRTHIVLSPNQEREDCIMVRSIEEALAKMKEATTDVYVIGGASVYRQMLPYCEEVLVTRVDAVGGAEVFFPNLDEDENFEIIYESEKMEDNGYSIRFVTYRNNNVQSF